MLGIHSLNGQWINLEVSVITAKKVSVKVWTVLACLGRTEGALQLFWKAPRTRLDKWPCSDDTGPRGQAVIRAESAALVGVRGRPCSPVQPLRSEM